jgi:nicotinate-nucleotide adenylyltransferase
MKEMAARTGERLAILGGTFDPPHIGHAIIAQDLVEELELDRLLVIPAAAPPHRTAELPPDVRFELTSCLFRDAPRIEVMDLELRRLGPSYTVDTLTEIRRTRSPARLFCIIGADQLRVIDTWKDYRRLPDLAEIAVMRREGEEPKLPTSAGSIAYITVHVTRIDVSGSRVRDRLGENRSIRYLVPETIRDEVERAWELHRRARPASAST